MRILCRSKKVLFVLFLCLVESSVVAAAQKPIEVYIDATGKHGVPATPETSTLTASIDGKPVQVISARPAKDDKLLFAIMLDISYSGKEKQKAMKAAAVKLFEALTGEHSIGYLVLFNVQSYASKRPVLPVEAQTILDHAEFTGGTSLYDCVAQVATGILDKAANPDTPRRLIIVLSDGQDNYSKMSLDEMEKAVEREGLSVFMLAQTSGNDPPMLEHTVEVLTGSSGGMTVRDDTMHDELPALISAVQSQMELTIAPPQTSSDGLHALSVRTSQKGISLAAPEHIPIP